MRWPSPRFCVLVLCGAMHGAVTAGATLLDIPTRPGVSVTVLEMTGSAEVRHVVLHFAGGSGQRLLRELDPAALPTDPATLFGAQQQLAQQVGAVVAVDTPGDHPVLEMIDRGSAWHRQDAAAVIAAMRQRHPGARIVLLGSSNGAYSVASFAAPLRAEIDAAVLVNANADSWALMTHFKRPVLGVHHRRDACIPFKQSYPRARFYPLIVVDDQHKPEVWQATPRDCGPGSAHALDARLAAVYGAIADWLLTGKVRETID